MTTSPSWSGTENRHQQAFHRLARDHAAIECVALRCKGVMVDIGHDRVQCEMCKLIIKKPHSRI